MQQTNRIYLYRAGNEWMARFAGPHERDARFLFSTDRIPVAFTAEAAPEQVLARIRELNPDSVVELEPRLRATEVTA